MTCNDIVERLGEYWDLPDQDELKMRIDRHILECDCCREEFDLWRESANLIQTTQWSAMPVASDRAISAHVMERIYKNESWRLPVAFRSYTFSYRVRRNIMACIAMCLTIFVVSFLYSFAFGGGEQSGVSDFAGILETAHAKSANVGNHPAMFDNIPVASISAPSILKVGPIQTYTDYLLVSSIIGFIVTLMLMNWLSRLRA